MAGATEKPASASAWRYATILALAAVACGLLLGGLSAWFLGSVAIAGLTSAALTFNFHIPGALVRMFAIGRTAARYGERLLGHKAALSDQVDHRVRLFAAMASAPGIRRAGWQLGDQARLADYLDDVEDIDFARLRANLPAITLAVALFGCAAATAFVAPLALTSLLLLAIATLLLSRRVAKTGAMAWEHARSLRREGAQRLGVAMASAIPLQAQGDWDGQCADALDAFSQADRDALALKRIQARLDAMTGLTGPIMALSVIGASWLGGARSEALLVPVFMAFAWIALGETMQGLSRMLVAVMRRRAADAAMKRWRGEATPDPSPVAQAPATLGHALLSLVSPAGRKLGHSIRLRLRKGKPTVLAGPSGGGKTSLLKQIAGWIGEAAFDTEAGAVSPAGRRAISMLCLHDAAILADSVRANLFAADLADEQLWAALDAVEMADRMRAAGGLDGWITQDMLSLGEAQRLNLARAWLTDKPVVLLDEPTEHLGAAQGKRILTRLAAHLKDRILVLSSHEAETPKGFTILTVGEQS